MPLTEYEGGWSLHADTCPCDLDFVSYLKTNEVEDKTIFHFGTGLHHTVGIQAALCGRNATLGVTLSDSEMDAYISMAKARPEIAKFYKVLYGDGYAIHHRLLPMFDYVTLFHLNEWDDKREERMAYGGRDDLGLACMLATQLKPGGRMLFYTGSLGWPRAIETVQGLSAYFPKLIPDGHYRSLLILVRDP